MKLDFAENVLDYLRDQGRFDLTIDLEEIRSSCCVGRIPEIRIHFNPPENPEKYRHFSAEDIHVHISNLLRTQNTLTLTLSGVGPFKKLQVSGLNLVL
ncbi:MAG: CC/Se motif family (seleno)protein [Nitrospinaceae bacterium]